nr:primase-helicase family protein [Enterovirga sp. DB1703]
MAFIARNPGAKVRWAPVIVGRQGVGKDIAFRPLHYAVGLKNVHEISPTVLNDKYTPYMEAQLVIVQEMIRHEKQDTYEKLKALITGTGTDTVVINIKNKPHYVVKNTACFMFFTNHADALKLSGQDRRYFIVEAAPQRPRDGAYYAKLGEWYERGGYGRILRYLQSVDLTGFDAATPKWTNAKTTMLEASRSMPERWIIEAFEPGGMFEHRTIVTVKEIDDAITGNVALRFSPPSQGMISRVLTEELKFVKRPSQARLHDGTKRFVYLRNEADLNVRESEIAARYKRETGANGDFTVIEGDKAA